MVNENGYYEHETTYGHVVDSGVGEMIKKILIEKGIKTAVDFGCGTGFYTNILINGGISCEGYDGNPNTPKLTNGIGKVLDFSNLVDLGKKYDCVLSLEVGEHIPKQYEQNFIDNLCNHCNDMIILSWAVVGQGGLGHVNCQNNDYVISEMNKRGFLFDQSLTDILRNSVVHAGFFLNTIMVFKK